MARKSFSASLSWAGAAGGSAAASRPTARIALCLMPTFLSAADRLLPVGRAQPAPLPSQRFRGRDAPAPLAPRQVTVQEPPVSLRGLDAVLLPPEAVPLVREHEVLDGHLVVAHRLHQFV